MNATTTQFVPTGTAVELARHDRQCANLEALYKEFQHNQSANNMDALTFSGLHIYRLSAGSFGVPQEWIIGTCWPPDKELFLENLRTVLLYKKTQFGFLPYGIGTY